jgi:hypothetical protein
LDDQLARSFPRLATLQRLAAVWLLAVGLGLGTAPSAIADGSWLDASTPANWNAPNQPLPEPVAIDLPIDPRAEARERPPETAEDQQLVDLGWRLFAAYQAGWGVTLIQAASGYDGMGRPWGYQVFVFVDGVFAGTLAPDLMDSRTDGALDRASLFGDRITGEFRRYAATDPLCCPSGQASVEYRVQRLDDGPIVVPLTVHSN